MKTRITAKAIRHGFKNVIEIGYCDLHYILHSIQPTYYTAGMYGWNADVYVIDSDTAIVTGYRPFGNIHPDYQVIREFKEAESRVNDSDYDVRRAKYYELLRDFIGTVLK